MTYFHKLASDRHKRNWISNLSNGISVLTSDQRGIKGIVINLYSGLFSSKNLSRTDIRGITDLMPPVVDQEMNKYLSLPFTGEEVCKVLFDLNPSKASGPDCFTALFFQNAWDTIGGKLTHDALKILNEGNSLKDWNATIISLVPKSKEPESMENFRPISLCNVSYKFIARAINNKLKSILGNIIDPHQSTFIPERTITDIS